MAGAGNTALAILLVFLLTNSQILFGPAVPLLPWDAPVESPAHPPVRGQARCAVLVVLDGLRADTARDPATMPYLNRLARAGGSGIARVESLVPSTVAAVVTFTTGQVPPAASFVQDFGAHPSAGGGLFAAVEQAGGRSFVAGPALWTDLFGRWIHDAEVDSSFGRQDRRLLEAGLAALRSKAYRLVVVHLQETDAAAHRFGAVSTRYAGAARRCDDAVRQIHLSLPADGCLLVTSDHGNIDAGGHAGPEPEVLQTPLITAGVGLPRGRLPDLRQRDIPDLLREALGLNRVIPTREPARPIPEGWAWWASLLGVVALGCGLRLWSSLSAGADGARQAFWLNLAVWATLALVLLGQPGAALACIAGTLAVTALLTHPARDRGLVLALAAGIVVGAARLFQGWWEAQDGGPVGISPLTLLGTAPLVLGTFLARARPTGGRRRPSPQPRPRGLFWIGAFPGAFLSYGVGGVRLAIVHVAAWATGLFLSSGHSLLSELVGDTPGQGVPDRKSPLVILGALAGVAPALCCGLLGRTVSLSTLDVRAAFAAVEFPFGVGLAIPLVVLADALPVLGLTLGLGPFLTRLRPAEVGLFAAALAATVTGQAVPMALLLAWAGGATVPAALALGGLLRVACELIYLFLTLAGVLWMWTPPEDLL